MNAVALSPDQVKLRAIRDAYAAIAPATWTRACDEHGDFCEMRGAFGELLVLARFEAGSIDEIEFACNAPDTVGFLLRLLAESFATIRKLRGEPIRSNEPARPAVAHNPKNYAAECAIKCKDDHNFWRFLHERHGLEKPLTEERVTQKVRSLLGVQSRNELNNGGAVSEAWIALRGDFDAWKRAG